MAKKIFLTALLLALTVPAAGQEGPYNVTLELELENGDVYVDGRNASPGVYKDSEISYSYIVTGQPLGIVSYGNMIQLELERNSHETLSMTTGAPTSFLIPFTRGGYRSIERRREEVTGKTFLELLEPSFGFYVPREHTVKVAVNPPYPIFTNFHSIHGQEKLAIRNRQGAQGSAVEILIQ